MASSASKSSEVWIVVECDNNGRPCCWYHSITEEIHYYPRPASVPEMPQQQIIYPPGSPSLFPIPPTEDIQTKPDKEPAREADKWSTSTDSTGRTVYYNWWTKKKQYSKPDCLKKYSAIR